MQKAQNRIDTKILISYLLSSFLIKNIDKNLFIKGTKIKIKKKTIGHDLKKEETQSSKKSLLVTPAKNKVKPETHELVTDDIKIAKIIK